MTGLSTEEILREKKTHDLTSITSLSLTYKALSNISCLSDFKNLDRLDLAFNNLTSLQGLESCLSLKWLSVQQNKLQSLKGIEGLVNLTVLNAAKNKLRSMDEVRNLLKLRALILNDNEIASISGLEQLKELNTLVLSRNPIYKMGNSLVKLQSIVKISLSNCQLEAIDSSIKACNGLEQLRLAHNDIKYIPPELAHNKRLQIIDLGNNVISKWSDLETLSSLHNLKNLNLLGNPIAEKAKLVKKISKLVPGLQIFNAKRMDKWNKTEMAQRVKDAASSAPYETALQKKNKRGHGKKIMDNDTIADDIKHVDSDKHLSQQELDINHKVAKDDDHVGDTDNLVKEKYARKLKVEEQKTNYKKPEISQAGEGKLGVAGNDGKAKVKKKDKERHAHILEPGKAIDKRSKRKADSIDVIDDREIPFTEILAYDAVENIELNGKERRNDRAAGNIESISALVTFPSKKKKGKNQGAGASVLQFLTSAAEVGLGGPSAWDDE